MTSERAGKGQVMKCPVGIAKEDGFYSTCHGKPLKNFKKSKTHELTHITGLK